MATTSTHTPLPNRTAEVIQDAAEALKAIVLNMEGREVRTVERNGVKMERVAPAVPTAAQQKEFIQLLRSHPDVMMVSAGITALYQESEDSKPLRAELANARQLVRELEKQIETQYPDAAANERRNSAAKAIAQAVMDGAQGRPIAGTLVSDLRQFVEIPKAGSTEDDEATN